MDQVIYEELIMVIVWMGLLLNNNNNIYFRWYGIIRIAFGNLVSDI